MDFQNLSAKITTAGESNIKYDVLGREQGFGYLSPMNTNSDLGVVVIQEWWGLNQSICITTDIFAQQGFRAISPDIYRGKCAHDHEEAGHLMSGLDWAGAVADIKGAVAFLKSQGCKKVGVVGFCMGGALTIVTMTNDPSIDAGCPFYGVPDLTSNKLENIKVPVYAHFGQLDLLKGFSSPEDAKNLEEKGKAAGVNIKIKIWPQAGHAFMNQDSKYYIKETADLALQEVIQFFKGVFTQ